MADVDETWGNEDDILNDGDMNINIMGDIDEDALLNDDEADVEEQIYDADPGMIDLDVNEDEENVLLGDDEEIGRPSVHSRLSLPSDNYNADYTEPNVLQHEELNDLEEEAVEDDVLLPEEETEVDLGGAESDSDSDGRENRDRFRSSTQDTGSVTVRAASQTAIPDTLEITVEQQAKIDEFEDQQHNQQQYKRNNKRGGRGGMNRQQQRHSNFVGGMPPHRGVRPGMFSPGGPMHRMRMGQPPLMGPTHRMMGPRIGRFTTFGPPQNQGFDNPQMRMRAMNPPNMRGNMRGMRNMGQGPAFNGPLLRSPPPMMNRPRFDPDNVCVHFGENTSPPIRPNGGMNIRMMSGKQQVQFTGRTGNGNNLQRPPGQLMRPPVVRQNLQNVRPGVMNSRFKMPPQKTNQQPTNGATLQARAPGVLLKPARGITTSALRQRAAAKLRQAKQTVQRKQIVGNKRLGDATVEASIVPQIKVQKMDPSFDTEEDKDTDLRRKLEQQKLLREEFRQAKELRRQSTANAKKIESQVAQEKMSLPNNQGMGSAPQQMIAPQNIKIMRPTNQQMQKAPPVRTQLGAKGGRFTRPGAIRLQRSRLLGNQQQRVRGQGQRMRAPMQQQQRQNIPPQQQMNQQQHNMPQMQDQYQQQQQNMGQQQQSFGQQRFVQQQPMGQQNNNQQYGQHQMGQSQQMQQQPGTSQNQYSYVNPAVKQQKTIQNSASQQTPPVKSQKTRVKISKQEYQEWQSTGKVPLAIAQVRAKKRALVQQQAAAPSGSQIPVINSQQSQGYQMGSQDTNTPSRIVQHGGVSNVQIQGQAQDMQSVNYQGNMQQQSQPIQQQQQQQQYYTNTQQPPNMALPQTNVPPPNLSQPPPNMASTPNNMTNIFGGQQGAVQPSYVETQPQYQQQQQQQQQIGYQQSYQQQQTNYGGMNTNTGASHMVMFSQLNPQTTQQRIAELASSVGTVMGINMDLNNCRAIVTFNSVQSATQCIANFNRQYVDMSTISVEYSY